MPFHRLKRLLAVLPAVARALQAPFRELAAGRLNAPWRACEKAEGEVPLTSVEYHLPDRSFFCSFLLIRGGS